MTDPDRYEDDAGDPARDRARDHMRERRPGMQALARAEDEIRRRSQPGLPGHEAAPARGVTSGPGRSAPLTEVARRTAVVTLVVLGLLLVTIAVWQARLVVALLALAFTIAAAMRPGIEALRRRGVPRGIGILIHYVVLAGLVALGLRLVVPQALDQIQQALNGDSISDAARTSSGVRHEILIEIDQELRRLPNSGDVVGQAVEAGRRAFEILVGIFFVFATAAYWILERDRTVDLVSSFVARPRRKRLRETWLLIDLRLGAYVRGQLLLVVLVAAALSGAFWLIGLPYWLIVGVFAGVVEIIPVIGPLAAGVVATGIGLSQSVHLGVLAVACVVGLRLLEDYLIMPRVLGHSVGLSPLIVLVSVTSVGVLFGGFAVILAFPAAVLVATIVDVVVREKDPATEDVPRVMFPAKDAE